MEVRMTNGLMPHDSVLHRLNLLWNELEPAVARKSAAPTADVIEDADNYRFYFEMPGIKSESVDVRVDDGHLIIEAERTRPQWSKDAQVHLSERTYGMLHRAFSMPDDASHEGITASYKDGMLEVTLPKKAESKPFKVKVEFGN
jgi:HSP20 family protein